jgi:hypothetical protein
VDTTLQVLSVLAVVASVLALAWQSREVAKATRLATKTAVASAMSDVTSNLRAIFEALITHPELRQYICDGAPLPTDPLALARAQTMCEMMCDAAEASLEVAAQVPGADQPLGGWSDWAAWVLSNSPGSAAHVSQRPLWYPRLHTFLPASTHTSLDVRSGTGSTDRGSTLPS